MRGQLVEVECEREPLVEFGDLQMFAEKVRECITEAVEKREWDRVKRLAFTLSGLDDAMADIIKNQ